MELAFEPIVEVGTVDNVVVATMHREDRIPLPRGHRRDHPVGVERYEGILRGVDTPFGVACQPIWLVTVARPIRPKAWLARAIDASRHLLSDR